MIVVSAGMQKSGTGWFFNLTNSLVEATGGDDTRELRTTSSRLERTISVHNCAIGPITSKKLAVLLVPHARGHRFTVKTHGPSTPALRALMALRAVRATYQYRDLRDVALSILDHSSKLRVDRPSDRMTAVRTVEDACRFVSELFPTWQAWTSQGGVFTVSYEDLRENPVAQLQRLAEHLGASIDGASAAALLEKHPAGAGSSNWAEDGLHFNKGQVGRFTEVLTREELDVCNRLLGPQLTAMGYELC